MTKNFLTTFLSLLLIICVLIPVSSCRYYSLEKKLNPDDADFLSKVRYLISEKEKRVFLEIPDNEKKAWIEEFWKQRDPDPGTEENELKMEYYNRIELATEMFRTELKSGWMSDRGRIFILFGPPMDKVFYPMGSGPQGKCGETWYYGGFPIAFVDEFCTGEFKLITYDLSGAREYNLLYMHALNLAQSRSQQTIQGEQKFYNFIWRVKKTLIQEDRVEGSVFIQVPYASIWFSDKEDKLMTTLDLHLELQNSKGEVVWEFAKAYSVETTEEELKRHKALRYDIEIPFVLTDEIEILSEKGNKLIAYLVNQTGGENLRKIMDFKIN
ncbi:GWxTD domain-containing protein [Acidobacteriota bacterium]